MPPDPVPKILVADDEALLQRLITRVLESAQFEVVTVGDGDAAIAAVEQDRREIGAVVLDVTMPPHGGEATLRAILERRANVGVVLTSGADLDPELSQLLRRSGGIFLPKPFAPDALVSAVRQALGGRSP